MVHVYALVRSPTTVPAHAGIGNAELRVVSVGNEIEAVVSDIEGAAQPSESAILAHARVVEGLAEANDSVLPARFGNGIPDEADLRVRLEKRGSELAAAFARVSGCVELGVRVFRVPPAAALPRRIDADPENVEKGLAQLVLTLVELLRQLMERQALRRMENGTLTDEEVDRLGETFMKLEQRMQELKDHFELEDSDLNLNLGPLGDLL